MSTRLNTQILKDEQENIQVWISMGQLLLSVPKTEGKFSGKIPAENC
jgi:hypothetical protein